MSIYRFFNEESYGEIVKAHGEAAPLLENMLRAFIGGGLLCLLGQVLSDLYVFLGIDPGDAGVCTSMSLIFLSALLTGLGVYDKLAVIFQGGFLLPVTGFANGIAAIALEHKKEGYIFGVGARMFQIAGPVILYTTLASVFMGLIYYILFSLGMVR